MTLSEVTGPAGGRMLRPVRGRANTARMFSHSSDFSDHPPLPQYLHRRGGPVRLAEVIAKVLALQAPSQLAPANPVEDPPPELPRAA